jgi:hypothetical protein
MASFLRLVFISAVSAVIYAKHGSTSCRDPKNLAGCPSEFSFFKPTTPEDAAITSSVLTHAVAELDDSDMHWEHQVIVDECQILTITIIHYNSDIAVSAKDPTGKTITPGLDVQEGFGINTGEMYPSRSIAFQSPKSGMWTVVLDLNSASFGTVNAYVIASVYLAKSQIWGTVESESLLVGSTVGLMAKMEPNPLLTNTSGSLSFKNAIKEAELTVSMPGGTTVREPMKESMASNNINDHMYKGQLYASKPGVYNARIDFKGVHSDTGEPFQRSLFYLFQVVEPAIKLANEPSLAEMHSFDVIEMDLIYINVPVEWDESSETVFRGFTQVWGTSDSGEIVPVAWLSGLMSIESSNRFNSTQYHLSFELHASWLDIAKASYPLYLRETNFDDIKAFVTLTSADSLKVSTNDRNLIGRKWRPHKPDDITYEMKNGYSSCHYLSQNSSQEQGTLVLVHGYCAKETPFDLDEFTDYAVLEDFNKNRLNDEFAQAIFDFVEQQGITKYSLVSHSQGGFGSLHLYTYYHSGVDNTGSGRKLQSIGTPYHGSAVAGTLADIGNIFGLLCGSNDDLTYDGAERWLGEIPPDKQNEVYYYTTQYGDGGLFGSYCIWGAGALLGHPNDGLVTISKTDLPEGHLVNHFVGECHSVGMHYDPQCKNKERNTEINSLAAR